MEYGGRDSKPKYYRPDEYTPKYYEYWEYIDGYKNPYGKEFYDYVKAKGITFSGSETYVRKNMFDCEYNRRCGGVYKVPAETPTWELYLDIVCDLILGD